VRGFLPVFAGLMAATAFGASALGAEGRCTGDACGAVKVSDDGCKWTNGGDRAVRFSLIAKEVARMATVLAPGATYKETDKTFCLAAEKSDPRFDVRFAVLADIPDEPVAVAKAAPPPPRGKPAVAATPAPSTAEVETAAPAVVAVAMPRPKPAPPPATPAPRPKPEAPADVAAVAPAVPVAAAKPVAPGATLAPASCGDACPPILFKTFDNCVWVLNFNPRPVAFEAIADGRKLSLALEAADGEKADAKAADAAGVHNRFSDPFQSAGSGIPFFRARLGSPATCVKDRKEISAFVANYAN
jgi:hypothetical protein